MIEGDPKKLVRGGVNLSRHIAFDVLVNFDQSANNFDAGLKFVCGLLERTRCQRGQVDRHPAYTGVQQNKKWKFDAESRNDAVVKSD